MSSTTLNLPYKRFVAQVSTGAPRPKSTYLSLMAENLEALRACPWREAAEVPVALVNHDFTAASHFSDAYDAFKMTGAWDAESEKEVAYAGMAAYRFAIPASAASVAISSVTLPISRDRFLLGGVHVAAVLDNSATPSTDWAVVTGQGASAYLVNSAANIVASRPADGALTITSTDLASLATTGKAYLWIYVTLEDYVDWWQQYSATEARQYAIEGSAMLVGGSAEVTFDGEVTPDAEPAVLLAGGSSPTWLQPLPTVNAGATAPAISSDHPAVEHFYSSKRTTSIPVESTYHLPLGYSTTRWRVSLSVTFRGASAVSAKMRSYPAATYLTAESTAQDTEIEMVKTAEGVFVAVSPGYLASGTDHYYFKLVLIVSIESNSVDTRRRNVTFGSYFADVTDPEANVVAGDPRTQTATYNAFARAYYYVYLRLENGVLVECDYSDSMEEGGRRHLPASVAEVSANNMTWSLLVDSTSYNVYKSGTTLTLRIGSAATGTVIGTFTTRFASGATYFDPSAAIRLSNTAVLTYGIAAAVGDFSHAVATFEAGTQPLDTEVLGRLARTSRASVGEMLYLHPESGALADELDVLRPVPRFFRVAPGSEPSQTTCQPGLSVWYRRPGASSPDISFVWLDETVTGTKVTNPAFLQLAILALRAPSAFATRLVMENFVPDTTTPTTNVATAITNHFKLRFVAWRSPADQWDGSNAFAMAAMASMPSIYRADGPASVAWSVDCTGSLLRFGTRAMTAERIGVSKTIIGEIAASAEIEIPIASPVGAGDVILIAPEVLGFADGAGGASKWFGRASDPSQGTAGWARYTHNLGWFPRVTGE